MADALAAGGILIEQGGSREHRSSDLTGKRHSAGEEQIWSSAAN
jgi:hypothetical protein